MTYSLTFCKFQILRKLMPCTLSVRKISTQAVAKIEKAAHKIHTIKNWISPTLTPLRIQEIESITGFFTGWNYISWLHMSVPELHVYEWNLKSLPKNFAKPMKESEILDFAYDVKESLPNSDLYIMESSSYVYLKHLLGLNLVKLSSMLAVLLNGLKRGLDQKEKVIFQEAFVMNYLYDIVISSERTSTRSIAGNILLKSGYLGNCDSVDESESNFPRIKLNSEFLENFKQSDFEMQETLSIVLLFTLSFIDVNVFRNEKSIEKIIKRKAYKKVSKKN